MISAIARLLSARSAIARSAYQELEERSPTGRATEIQEPLSSPSDSPLTSGSAPSYRGNLRHSRCCCHTSLPSRSSPAPLILAGNALSERGVTFCVVEIAEGRAVEMREASSAEMRESAVEMREAPSR